MEFDKVYGLYQQALVLEKDKKQNEALKIYLYILENFTPEGTAYYERPAIILEKLKLYNQAIEVCNKAIKAINQKVFNADVDEFTNRLNRLKEKLAKQKNSTSVVPKKNVTNKTVK